MLRSKTHLHETLKHRYAGPDGRLEVLVGPYWVDVLREDRIVEIQTGNFHSIRRKVKTLSQERRVQLVHPIPATKMIVKRAERGGGIVSRRRSPKHGRLRDIFGPLTRLAGLLPGPNLTLTVLLTEEEEHRVDDGRGSWRRKGVSVVDRVLTRIVQETDLHTGDDYLRLWETIPPSPFTTKELAQANHESRSLAQQACYFLSRGGVLRAVDRTREGIWYVVVREECGKTAAAEAGCTRAGH